VTDATGNGGDVVMASLKTLADRTYFSPVDLPVVGSGFTPNTDNGNTFHLSLSGNYVLDDPTGTHSDGQKMMLRVKQWDTHTLTINGAKYRFDGLGAPVVTSGSGEIDYFGFMYHGSDDKWDLIGYSQGLS
jgi:hypothetical protein